MKIYFLAIFIQLSFTSVVFISKNKSFEIHFLEVSKRTWGLKKNLMIDIFTLWENIFSSHLT